MTYNYSDAALYLGGRSDEMSEEFLGREWRHTRELGQRLIVHFHARSETCESRCVVLMPDGTRTLLSEE